MHDLQDWKEHCSEKAVNGKTPSLALLGQAAVRAENLTGDPNWDTFLSYLQFSLEAATKEQAAWRALLEDPHLIEYGPLLAAKIAHARLRERITVLKAVLTLPADIIKNGKQAEDLLHTSLPAITQ